MSINTPQSPKNFPTSLHVKNNAKQANNTWHISLSLISKANTDLWAELEAITERSGFLKSSSAGKTDQRDPGHFHGTMRNIRTCRFPAAILDKRCPIMCRITGHHWLAALSYGRASSTGHQEVPHLLIFPHCSRSSDIPCPSSTSNSFHARCLWRFVKPCHVPFPFPSLDSINRPG